MIGVRLGTLQGHRDAHEIARQGVFDTPPSNRALQGHRDAHEIASVGVDRLRTVDHEVARASRRP